jgi:hypothetical protein
MKLTLKNTLALSVVAVTLGFFFASLIMGQETKTAYGSTSRGSEYQSSMATSGLASASVSKCFTADTLGSAVVTASSSAGYIRFWDATSTATSTYQNEDNTATNTTYGRPVADIRGGGVQTFTFDAVLFKGLCVETSSGFNGIVTVTRR